MVSFSEYLNYCKRQREKGRVPTSFGEWKQFQLNQNILKKVA